MNNPDHSTYHDFDDDDPEVGISFNHRIRWSFCLPAKQWLWLIEPQIFCDLGIVSRVAFTFTYAVLSLIQALSKSHSIFGKGSLKRKIFKYIKSLFIAVLQQFWNSKCGVLLQSWVLSCILLSISLWSYVSICKESIHQNDFIPM